jgi:hypothetical protein
MKYRNLKKSGFRKKRSILHRRAAFPCDDVRDNVMQNVGIRCNVHKSLDQVLHTYINSWPM